jgi:hypothetical protein
MKKNSQRLTDVERLRGGANSLAVELARANTHLRFFRALLSGYAALSGAKDFWDYTLAAHGSMVIRNLCVVYDTHSDGMNLINLLGLVGARCLDPANTRRLRTFAAIVGRSSADPHVGMLRKWRNNIVAHYNTDIALTERDSFSRKYLLEEDMLQVLIDRGFEIVDWCAVMGGRPTVFERFAEGKDEHQAVLAAWEARSGPNGQ